MNLLHETHRCPRCTRPYDIAAVSRHESAIDALLRIGWVQTPQGPVCGHCSTRRLCPDGQHSMINARIPWSQFEVPMELCSKCGLVRPASLSDKLLLAKEAVA